MKQVPHGGIETQVLRGLFHLCRPVQAIHWAKLVGYFPHTNSILERLAPRSWAVAGKHSLAKMNFHDQLHISPDMFQLSCFSTSLVKMSHVENRPFLVYHAETDILRICVKFELK